MENMEQVILSYIQSHPKGKRRLEDILAVLEITTASDYKELTNTLNRMEKNFDLFRTSEGQYETREMAGIQEGVLRVNKAGVGYIDREGYDSIKVEEKDQGTALNGDTVLVKCQKWQVYGQIIGVSKRAREHVIGTFVDKGRGLRFVPDDEKIADKFIRMLDNMAIQPVDGVKVLCEIERFGTPLYLRPVRVLGHKDDPGIDILSILLDHGIDAKFPDEVMEQVQSIPSEVPDCDLEGRRDLTGDITVTIDGDGSKDFDDAVSVVREGAGYILKVSIADVSHYVTEDSPLDKEALKRGCSTYVTDRVVPMLPHELSNGICSLNPHVIRLTQTCEMHVNAEGVITDYELYESYIRSTERMTYSNVNRILDGDEELQAQYAHLGDLFFVLRDCADAIRKNRHAKGAIDFDTEESEIIVDEEGHPVDIHPRTRGHAEMMIEDCMIAANVSVANFLKWQEIPAVYRVHGTPKAERLKNFTRVSELMGKKFILRSNDVRPNEFQRYLESVKDEECFPVLSTMLLRCMQKAKYENVCSGHFGLAEEEYLHFTSPIRRYPDLIVHRMLRKYSFNGLMDEEQRAIDDLKCAEYAEQSSIRERASQDAEYECEDHKKAEYMEDYVGSVFEGLITGVTSFGFFVQLPNTVEGLVSAATLRDDYYSFNQDRMELTGSRSKKTYRIGMKVKVRVASADRDTGKIDFEIRNAREERNDRNDDFKGRRETRAFSNGNRQNDSRRHSSHGSKGFERRSHSSHSSHSSYTGHGKSYGNASRGKNSSYGKNASSEKRVRFDSEPVNTEHRKSRDFSKRDHGRSSFGRERTHSSYGRKK